MAIYDIAKDSWKTIRDWPIRADKPYRFAATLCALVAVIAVCSEKRPSDVIAGALFFLGLRSIGEWFGGSSPPVLHYTDAGAQELVLNLASLLFVMHILVVVRRGWPRWDESLHGGKES